MPTGSNSRTTSRRTEPLDAFEWFSLRRDVLFVGDDGAGKTTLLKRIGRDARDHGLNNVLVTASRLPDAVPLSAFRFHDLATRRRNTHTTESELLTIFADELVGRRALLLVDDIDALDDGSLLLLSRLLLLTPAVLAATTSVTVGEGNPLLLTLLSGRAPAQIEVAPLDIADLSQLAGHRLGGVPSARLVTRVLAASGGNPRVAEAILDSGRWNGSIALVDDVLTDVSDILAGPLDAVVHALTDRLSPADRRALQRLADVGTLDPREAEALVGPEALGRLRASNRLIASREPEHPLLALSPPALQAALRRCERGHDLAARASPRNALDSTLPDSTERLLQRVDELVPFAREAADLACARLREEWRRSPRLAAANQYLLALGAVDDIAAMTEVFDGSAPAGADSPDDRVRYARLAVEWSLATGRSDEHARSLFAGLGIPDTDTVDLERLRAWLRGEPLPSRHPDQTGSAAALRPFEIGLLVDSGQVQTALTSGAAVLSSPLTSAERAVLELHVTNALVLSGDTVEASTWAADCLTRACQELSMPLLRSASLGLARSLWFRGESENAWRAILPGLRLGPSGPFDPTHSHILTLGSTLQHELGNPDVAAVLAADVRNQIGTGGAPYEGVRAIAATDVSMSSDDGGLWSVGRRLLDRGSTVPAIHAWLLTRNATADQLEELRSAAEGISSALMLQLALAKQVLGIGGDLDIIRVLSEPAIPLPFSYANAASIAVARARSSQGLAPAATEEDTSAVRGATHRNLSDEGSAGELSSREREVASLASRGLSNKQIASQLSISVRTVENHMYRLLRKLGLNGRNELADRWGLR